MTGLEIAALIAMLAGTAVQYKTTDDASKRAAAATRQALQRQDELQQQAEKKATETAKTFNPADRAQAQADIETQMAQEFARPAVEAQNINAAQSTTQGNVSDDYTAAKARSNVETLKSAEALARLLGKTQGANRLRSDEALRMADSAAGIDRIGRFSRGDAAVDQLAINNAARPDATMQLVGGLLSTAGAAGMSYGGSTSAPQGTGVGLTPATAENPMGGYTGSYGLQPTGGTGFKAKGSAAILGPKYANTATGR